MHKEAEAAPNIVPIGSGPFWQNMGRRSLHIVGKGIGVVYQSTRRNLKREHIQTLMALKA